MPVCYLSVLSAKHLLDRVSASHVWEGTDTENEGGTEDSPGGGTSHHSLLRVYFLDAVLVHGAVWGVGTVRCVEAIKDGLGRHMYEMSASESDGQLLWKGYIKVFVVGRGAFDGIGVGLTRQVDNDVGILSGQKKIQLTHFL